jgi:MraZ protein
MFLGEYSHNLDEKGRLTLPARWREELGESVVITRGMERCLFVFRASDLEKFLASINTVGITGADARGLSRFFSSKATEDTPDKQGRITIPQNLREFAGLNGEVMVVGANDHGELWSPTLYAQADAALVNNVPDISERVNQALREMSGKSTSL